MSPSIHGHDVLALLETPTKHTRATLLAAVKERFGEDARFHTCSAEGMTATELLEFLDARGKLQACDGHLERTPGSACDH